MGSPPSEERRDSDEGPQHRVTIPKAFAVGKYEVRFAEWDACVSAGGCGKYRPRDQGWTLALTDLAGSALLDRCRGKNTHDLPKGARHN